MANYQLGTLSVLKNFTHFADELGKLSEIDVYTSTGESILFRFKDGTSRRISYLNLGRTVKILNYGAEFDIYENGKYGSIHIYWEVR